MHDARDVWFRCAMAFDAQTFAQLRRIFGNRLTVSHCLVMAYAPVIENAGFFEPHPNPRRAGRHSWRWLIPVRHTARRAITGEWRPEDEADPSADLRRRHGLGPPI